MDGPQPQAVDDRLVENPPDSPHHDVLITTPVINARGLPELYRFVVDKQSGAYNSAPIKLDPGGSDEEKLGERKVRGLIRQDSGSGIAFATLPVKDEPASSAVCCYLINRQLLDYTTVWTRAPWNDHPDDPAAPKARPGIEQPPGNPTPRFLLALSTGEVLDVEIEKTLDGARAIQAKPLDLKSNPDVWRLLRNGCVVGAAKHADGTQLPVFNIASVRVPDNRPKEVANLGGTLDFKWRPGQTVKVRFDDYDPLEAYGVDRTAAIKAVEVLARSWVAGDVNLKLDFLDLTRAAGDSKDDYDVLVTLRPLGENSNVVSGVKPIDPERKVLFPMSQLGSYAERAERDQPTMFLGIAEGLKGPSEDEYGKIVQEDAPIDAKKYFKSRTFKHTVLHEFGHALGLAHLHQHPGLKKNPFEAQAVGTIQRGIKLKLGITVSEAYVNEELKGVWPGLKYSDWPAIKSTETDDDAIKRWIAKSVMIGLPSRQVIIGDFKGEVLTELGETDREWINLLYPLAV